VLAFIARRLDGIGALVIATSSSSGRVPDLGDAFREVHLGRLDESAAHQLLAHVAPDLDQQQCEWVIAQSAGNPLALVELAKEPTSCEVRPTNPLCLTLTLSPALERAFTRRWEELPDVSRDAVLVAALDADASLQEILAATARLQGQDVTTVALETPRLLGLLSFDETHVRFRHPLVRTAIAQKESVSRTQAAHRALGAVVTVNSHRRAWHRALGCAAHDDAIAAELEATTADSLHRGDTPAAILALERAAQLSTAPTERGRRILLAARHAFRLGRADWATRQLSTAIRGELSDFDRVRAQLLREDIEGAVSSDSNEVIQLCRVASQAAAAGETELAFEIARAAGRRRCAAPVNARARFELNSLARALARGPGDARALPVLALAEPIEHGRAVLSALSEIEGDDGLDADALNAYAAAARAVGNYSCALRLLDRAESAFRSRGLSGMLARTLGRAVELRLELGEWQHAAAALRESAALSSPSTSAGYSSQALVTAAKAVALRGDTAGALELVCEMEHSPAARSGSSYLARAQIVRGIAYLSSGHHLDAYLALARVFDLRDPSHHFREEFGALAYLAEAASRSGKQDPARDVVERMQLVADRSGAPLLTTHLCYARAVLASDDTAESLFLAGLASDASSAPWPRARLQLAYGRWLRRQQRVTQSRGPLQASLETLHAIGATRWAEEARDELAASGARVEEGRIAPAHGFLSAQESKIAQLVALGLSNREIGQQLYLSPRTVSSHLYRIFPKLGISTRGQIAARLDEQNAIA